MSGQPPHVQPPSSEEIQELAERHFIDLTEEELQYFTEMMPVKLQPYERLDQLQEPRERMTYTDRDLGYRPDTDEDPNNATITRCRVTGADDGPLSGYTVGLKDNIALAGVAMTCGSKVLDDYVPSTDATVVTRLLDAGATITAKLNMDNLSFAGSGEFTKGGPVLNPHNSEYTSGGSSAGPAAAVAERSVDIAIGGDQGGSIRKPAGYCGVVGLKPTYGLVPYTGILGIGHTIDHAGPIGETVEDVALTLDVIAGKDPLDPRQGHVPDEEYSAALTDSVEDLTIGLVREGYGLDISDPEVDETVRDAAEEFEALGADVTEISIPWHTDAMSVWTGCFFEEAAALMRGSGLGFVGRGYYDTQLAEAFGKARQTQADDFPPILKFVSVLGEYLTETYHGRYHMKAQNLRRELVGAYDEAFEDVDVLVLPTTPKIAPEIQDELTYMEMLERVMERSMVPNTAPFNVTGHPGVSVPCGKAHGMPVGMHIVGPQFDDATILRAAHAFEQNTDWTPN